MEQNNFHDFRDSVVELYELHDFLDSGVELLNFNDFHNSGVELYEFRVFFFIIKWNACIFFFQNSSAEYVNRHCFRAYGVEF